jgi:hypothetical protein
MDSQTVQWLDVLLRCRVGGSGVQAGRRRSIHLLRRVAPDPGAPSCARVLRNQRHALVGGPSTDARRLADVGLAVDAVQLDQRLSRLRHVRGCDRRPVACRRRSVHGFARATAAVCGSMGVCSVRGAAEGL